MPKLKKRIRVGITMGDPSGIGPCIIAKALPRIRGGIDFIIILDKWVFDKASKQRPYKMACASFIDLANVPHKNFRFGKIKAEYGRASIEYLDKAMELLQKKEIDCLVTAPISKIALHLAGFKFTGHTEYFAQRTQAKDTVMMLLNKQLKFSLVTRHVALREVPSALNKDKLYKTILLSYQSLRKLFSINEPRLGVCGLNPHASDNGLIGDEERRIIQPALKKLRRIIPCIVDGPLPADTAVERLKQGLYDCVIAMYHDQALIPLKLLDSSTGVNLTLGLPFIRTSPLHGTAFDIADTGLAKPDSLIAAIELAVKCSLKQKKV